MMQRREQGTGLNMRGRNKKKVDKKKGRDSLVVKE